MLANFVAHGSGTVLFLLPLGLAIGLFVFCRLGPAPKALAATRTDGAVFSADKAAQFFEIIYYGVHVALLALLPLYFFLA